MERRSDKITFITWLWEGWRNVYTEKHVAALKNMLDEYAPPHRLVCVSDRIIKLPNVYYYPLWENPYGGEIKPNCFHRLKLFDPDFGPRFGPDLVSIDLDVLLGPGFDSLFDRPTYFRGVEGVSALINGSMWQLTSGAHRQVWEHFAADPDKAVARLAAAKERGELVNGSDQGWISMYLGHCEKWNESHGVRHWSENKWVNTREKLPGSSLICFAGKDKPWDSEVKRITPDLYRRYMEFYDA